MKPRNFPDRRARRIARMKLSRGLPLTDVEQELLMVPKDIRIRVGRTVRAGGSK